MPVIVTLNMYSGRPNPSWEMSKGDARQFRKLLARKRRLSTVSSSGSSGMLGYRGLLVTSTDHTLTAAGLRVFDGVMESASFDIPNMQDSDSELEEFLLTTAGATLQQEEREYILGEIGKNVSGGVASSIAARESQM